MWVGGFNDIAGTFAQSIDLAVVAAAHPKTLRDHARTRSWYTIRLLSWGSSTFKFDLGSDDPDGGEDFFCFSLLEDADNTARHLLRCASENGVEDQRARN
jgi:hypothetical protein